VAYLVDELTLFRSPSGLPVYVTAWQSVPFSLGPSRMSVHFCLVALTLLLPASSPLAETVTGKTSAPTEYVLVSWHGPPDCVHVLLSQSQYTAIIKHVHRLHDDYPQRRLLYNVRQLEAAIAQLPEHSTIEWRDYFPAETAFPPQPIIDRVKAFAAARGIEVRILPGQPPK
jgi:hypothetical protein